LRPESGEPAERAKETIPMANGIFNVPMPGNEPVHTYEPGSDEREGLKARLEAMTREELEIPLVIGGERVTTGDLGEIRAPHDHSLLLARYHKARATEVEKAVAAGKEAAMAWAAMPWESRASVFLKAADLIAGPWRDTLNAATMLGQNKNVQQSEIDAACELIDFLRFNAFFMEEVYSEQPASSPGMWNYVDHRPLEGFVFAVTPFNFTAIGGNLPTSPAMMGNVVLWKPASSAVLSAWYFLRILEEAGLPPGVINFVPGSGSQVGDPALQNPDLAGIHFTGSTSTFQRMWRQVGENITRYKGYPRIVGETGGKDFIFAHPTADVAALVTASLRGAFEYQGQKCSAASRAYIPASLWDEYTTELKKQVGMIRMGSPLDFRNFMCAVIDKAAFETITGYIDRAKKSGDAEILCGGEYDGSRGWFIQPTVIVAANHDYESMREEIFGPVLTLYRYEDDALDETLRLCDSGSPYALTGAVFARDRRDIVRMSEALRFTAGNFYINDKPTGAVVGQQPFGGARASGTNDKAGSVLNLIRWVSPRAVKETFVPPTDFRYPHMGDA
jgi:1-pyrroline-5-carboxylate dehydrogenase